jgi:pyruvate/2-oxoglutarate dehydrogenase complex dihydrolipoamide dehydrogenase (E3) component
MYDLVVLGGGSEGLSVALAAARKGARVALVKSATAGGGCTHPPIVPRRALITAANLAHQAQGAQGHGIRPGAPAIDFAAVMARVRGVAADFASRATDESLAAAGIEVVRGLPVFEAYDTVVVGGRTRLHAQRFVIATGSRPALPDIPGLAEAEALDESSFWGLDTLPPELVILGAEAAAIEFAQALRRLGSKVTVLAGTATILAREDEEVSHRVKALLTAEGIDFRTNVEVTSVVVDGGRRICTVRDKASRATSEVSGTHLLVASGRLANVEGLDLEAVGIHGDPAHGVEVDEYLQTHSTRILAIGGVIQGPASPAATARQVAVAVQNAVLRLPRKIDYSALPWTTFIDPEVASVGLGEAEAHERHPEVRVFRVEVSELDRARIDGQTEGFAKLLATPSGKILGATVVGPEASLVLQEFVLAMQGGVSLQHVAETIPPYPTYADLVHRLAEEFEARRHETSLVHKALRWLHGYQARAADGGTAPEASATEHSEPAGHAGGHGHGH